MKRGQRIWLGALGFLISVLLCGLAGAGKGCMTVYAAEDTVDYDAVESGAESKLFSEFDFSEIDNSLQKIFPEEKMDCKSLVTSLIEGDGKNAGELIMEFISDQFAYEFRYNRQNLAYMLLIAVIAAIFTNFSNAFQNRQVSEISFYVLYILLITMCLNAFRIAMSGIEGHRLGKQQLADFL